MKMLFCRRPATSITLLALLLLATLASPVRAEWVFREEAIMGTRCAVELWSEKPAEANKLIDQVFAEFRRIDLLMSTYKPASQVSRVNALAAKQHVRVDVELFDLLQTALEYSKISNGAFDITYASVGYLYDFREHIRPDAAHIAAALPGVNWRHLELRRADHSVHFQRPGMRIDLGGIGKGYAVDRGTAILQRAGVQHAMVNAGGDTRIIGDHFGKPWIVGVRDPNDRDKVALRLPLENTAISTSGDYERFFDEGGVRYHHILDPKTGDSARKLRSVSIIASTATRTDALTKLVYVNGPDIGIAMINKLDDADAIVITNDGRILYSDGLTPP